MGMYDIVWIPCPKCGGKIEFQSKFGKCDLIEYEFGQVPPGVLAYLDDESQICEKCGAEVGVKVQCMATLIVKKDD